MLLELDYITTEKENKIRAQFDSEMNLEISSLNVEHILSEMSSK